MAYYLTINKNNEHKKLDISLLDQFKRFSKFKNEACSLEDINNCTSMFKDEVSFKKSLYERGIIDFDDITKDIAIRYSYEGKLEKVTYGLVYGEQVKYLDVEYLRMKLLSMQSDMVFLEKLAKRYKDSYSNNITISQLRNCLDDDYYRNKYLFNILNAFVNRELYYVVKSTGELRLKYKSLHDLAMFIYNYVNKKEQEKLGQTDESFNVQRKQTLLELQKSKLGSGTKYIKSNVKKLTKKEIGKIPIEGQISLFD